MAEFLIYKGPHWMDALSPQEVAERVAVHKHFQQKYDARYQRGDIVEARPDNGPRGKLEEASFIFLQVSSISLKDAKQYCVPDEDLSDSDNPILTRRRKYYINMIGLTPGEHENIGLTEAGFNSRLVAKA